MAQTTSPTISKCSPRPQPLKAFLPITSVTKDASGVNWKSESNSPSLLSPTIGWKSGLRSPGASSRGYSKLSYADPLSLKRTASFDTIYLQPSFNHKNHYVYGNAHTMLCIDKSTQTIDGGSRFKHDSVSDDDKLDKFFRHRTFQKGTGRPWRKSLDSFDQSTLRHRGKTLLPALCHLQGLQVGVM
uniref:Uncharacterized protein n=1 Tax=Cacopsylla melanoneura TaxID=428564 RepID=A0A8D8TYN9_9HEMI